MKVSKAMLFIQQQDIGSMCEAEVSKAKSNGSDEEELKKLNEFLDEVELLSSNTEILISDILTKDIQQIYIEFKDELRALEKGLEPVNETDLHNQTNAVSHVCLLTMTSTLVVTNNIEDLSRLANTVGKVMQEASMTRKLHGITTEMSLAQIADIFLVDYTEWYTKHIPKAIDIFNATTLEKINELQKHNKSGQK